jgi:predicted PurR-regulated permease PerM
MMRYSNFTTVWRIVLPEGFLMSELPLSPSRLRTPILPAETPGMSGLMTLATGVVVVAALAIARDVLIPITLAVLLSFVLAPLVAVLRRIPLWRVPAVLLAVLLALGIIVGLGGVIGAQVAGLAENIPRYASTIQGKVQALQGNTAGRLSALVNRLANQVERAGDRPAERAKNTKAATDNHPAATDDAAASAGPPKPISVEVHQPTPSPVELAQRILAPVLAPLATTGIVLVVAIFILLQQEDLRDRLIRLFGARDLHRTMTAMDDAARRLSRYFLTQLALNAGFGCIVGLGLLAIGVPGPMLWGIVAALMRFVPYIGSFLSAAIPLALAAAVDPGWAMAAWTGALFLIGELLMGQVVEPLVYGHSTGLSPVSVIVAAIFWGWLWGPIGLILSMPLTLCLVVLGRHVDRLEFLDVLLGNRPALTPVESFYHRMLAGDLDEVQDYAEQLLKDRSLSSYYDEVAIRGLQLAALDIERGVLTQAQIALITDGIDGLLDELSDYDDRDPAPDGADNNPAGPSRDQQYLPRQPAPVSPAAPGHDLPAAWRAPSAVLCVTGRGALDGAAAAILVQLLHKHGIGAHAVAQSAVGSRATLAATDLAGVMMVCLMYTSINGAPSHLRYAVRRLRHRLPTAPILVGLWPAEVVKDDRLRAAVNADCYAASLREAVNACLEQALASQVSASAAAA